MKVLHSILCFLMCAVSVAAAEAPSASTPVTPEVHKKIQILSDSFGQARQSSTKFGAFVESLAPLTQELVNLQKEHAEVGKLLERYQAQNTDENYIQYETAIAAFYGHLNKWYDQFLSQQESFQQASTEQIRAIDHLASSFTGLKTQVEDELNESQERSQTIGDVLKRWAEVPNEQRTAEQDMEIRILSMQYDHDNDVKRSYQSQFSNINGQEVKYKQIRDNLDGFAKEIEIAFRYVGYRKDVLLINTERHAIDIQIHRINQWMNNEFPKVKTLFDQIVNTLGLSEPEESGMTAEPTIIEKPPTFLKNADECLKPFQKRQQETEADTL